MAFNGSGTFVRDNGVNTGSDVWEKSRDAGTAITVAEHDAHDEDLGDGLTNCICRDGQSTITADIPFSSQKATNVGAAAARTQWVRADQLQDGDLTWGGTSTGSSNAYVMSLTPAITAYAAGMRISFVANHTNSGAATLNINSVGATAIKKGDGTVALAANDIVSGSLIEVVYETTGGAHFRLVGSQGLATSSSPTFAGLTLSGLSASLPVFTDGSKLLVSKSAADTRSAISAPNIDGSDLTGANGIAFGASWTPTLTASGSMTVTSQTIDDAAWVRIGPYILFSLTARYTLGGTTSNYIYIPAPVAGTAHDVNVAFKTAADANGTGTTDARWQYDGTRILLFQGGLANWTLGANGACNIQGFYRA